MAAAWPVGHIALINDGGIRAGLEQVGLEQDQSRKDWNYIRAGGIKTGLEQN